MFKLSRGYAITLALFALCVPARIHAELCDSGQIVLAPGNLNGSYIGNRVERYIDATHRITIDEISNERFSSRFVKNDSKTIVNPGERSIWLKIRVRNDSGGELDWYLENDFVFSEESMFYYPDKNGRYHSMGYVNAPAGRRAVNNATYIFPVRTPPGERVYYLYQFHKGWTTIVPRMWSPGNLSSKLLAMNVFLGMFYGILAIMFVYNLFVFLSVHEKSYFYYLLIIVGLTYFSMTLDGIGYNYVWEKMPAHFFKNSHSFFYYLGLMPVPLFIKSYLQTREKSPFINTQINGLIAFSILMSVASLALEPVTEAVYHTVILNVYVLVLCIYNIVVPILHIKKGSRPAAFYLPAVVLLVASSVPTAIFFLGFSTMSGIALHGPKLGIVSMLALFSFGLADRINTMKNELADLNENLEKKVEMRTDELREANEKLKRLDRVKSDFFTNVSHEIRTPLTLILSPIESLLQGKYAGEIDGRFFRSIHRNAARLLKLVNSLLDFSRIEAGRMVPSLHLMDMVEFMELRMESSKAVFDSRGISAEIEREVDGLRFHFDPEMMDRIVMNLLSNALKFTGRGGTVRITVGKRGGDCLLRFSDSGCGIPADKIQTVFERFIQADTGTARRHEGTGIGLALVREMVRLHGGRIDIESRHADEYPVNHGTSITITVPLDATKIQGAEIVQGPCTDAMARPESTQYLSELMNRDEPPAASTGVEAAPRDDTREKILVVEDNPDMRELLNGLLKGGYRVSFAVNGREGLARAEEIVPDLIISDVMMPEMDGYEMTNKLKGSAGLRDIPVIMLTAKADSGSVVEGLERGADDFVTKPFNADELLTRVKSQLRSKEIQRLLSRRNREIEEELAIARSIQRQLLPADALAFPGYRVEWRYIPMDLVGGDLLAVSGNGEFVELFIADVTGHGLPGACLSLITKASLDAIEDRRSPGKVLNVLNDVVCRSTIDSRFVTAFYASIDARRNVMSYCSAGHYPPLLYRGSSGEFITLIARGIPLGLNAGMIIEETEITLMEGDRMLLYTDGISDCLNGSKEIYGEQRLKALMKNSTDLSPRKLADRIIEEVTHFTRAAAFDDDAAFIVFDVVGSI